MTPLQMAMVAAAIANDGVVMEPHVIDRILSPKGSIVTRSKPEELQRAVKPETAATVGSMMRAAVECGTGTAARIPGASSSAARRARPRPASPGTNNAWFIAFAGRERERPKVAIAVVLEQQNGTGGQLAAPIAQDVMQAILGPTAN